MSGSHALRIALWLIVASLVLGTLAGGLNRTLVEMPAWHQLGPEAWAAFSRLADLGNGKILYPAAGIGGALFTLAAAVAFRCSPLRPFWGAIPVYGSVLMYGCVLLLTTRAAPVMLSLQHPGSDSALLQTVFDEFYRWDSIRALFGTAGDCAAIWSLLAVTVAFLKCKGGVGTGR
jgi:hypothetical protein